MEFTVSIQTIDCPGCGKPIPTPNDPERWLQPFAWCADCGGRASLATPDSIIVAITTRWPHAEVTFPKVLIEGEAASN